MARRVSEAELAQVVEAVARLPDGGSVAAIGQVLGGGVSRRTLQRRLAVLVAEGRLVRDGRGQATRYRIPHGEAVPSFHPAGNRISSAPGYPIPLSPEGASIGESVRAPIQARAPVAYRRAFLDDYRPGATW